MLNTFLSLVTAIHMMVTPTACVRSNLTTNASTFASITGDAVAQTVAQQLRSRGWTVYQTLSSSDTFNSCNGSYIISVGGTAVQSGDVTAFTILVQAYEKMDSKNRQGWYYWAEHHDSFGTWTAFTSVAGQSQSQFMAGVAQYVTEVAQNVENDPIN